MGSEMCIRDSLKSTLLPIHKIANSEILETTKSVNFQVIDITRNRAMPDDENGQRLVYAKFYRYLSSRGEWRVLTHSYMIYNKMYNALEGNTDWHYPDRYLPKGVKRIRTCSTAGQLQYVSSALKAVSYTHLTLPTNREV